MTNSPSSDNPTSFDRSAQFWMRAYPLRWRETFADDLLAVLADVTDPDAVRVPAAEAAQIVRAGWACRWREHPMPWDWLRYRFMGLRLPEGYQAWAMDDLRGRLWFAREFLLPMLLWYWFMTASVGFIPEDGLNAFLPLGFAFAVWVAFLSRRPRMRYAWRKFVETEPPPEFWTARSRVRAHRKRTA